MAKADVPKAPAQDGETEESRTKREGVKGPQDEAASENWTSGHETRAVRAESPSGSVTVPGLKESAQTPHTTRDGKDLLSARQPGVPDVNTALRGGRVATVPVVPVETQAAREAAAKRVVEGGTFDADGYPVAGTDPGAAEHVTPLLNHLNAITDPGALAMVLAAVVSRCQAGRVRPEVLATAVKAVATVNASGKKSA